MGSQDGRRLRGNLALRQQLVAARTRPAVRCDLGIILTPDNVVACVAKINGIIKRDDMRMGFIGKPIHGDYDNWIGKILERNDSKNPIAYFDERAILPPSKVTKDTEKLNR